MTTEPWTTPEELIARLRSRWNRGQYLRAHAQGEAWSPITVSIKGPKADDVLRDPAAVSTWCDHFRRASHARGSDERFTIEYRTVRSRALGDNEVPARIRIETLEQLAELLGRSEDIARLDLLLDATQREVPEAVPWVATHPLDALANHTSWNRLLTVVGWIRDNDTASSDLRHVDVPGVDTKFVEQHRKVLGQLLSRALPPARLDLTTTDFARRYGFRPRPRYIRFRLLAPVVAFPPELTELEVRASELAQVELPIRTAFVIENKTSYLAFPGVPNAIAIFGEGFGVTTLELVPWLAERELVYWGDIDTHGFAILNRLRERVRSVRSLLMDHETLNAHRDQVVSEPTPTNAHLGLLTPDEAELYRDLVEDRHGNAVRLEQERVRFSFVRNALAPFGCTE